MCYIPDYFDKWSEYSRQQGEALNRLPKCCECNQPIQDEYAYYIHDEWICQACMDRNYKEEVLPEW